MTTLESNRCYACNKIFCCADCCTEHIRKKHPGRESKCPLCRAEDLRVKNFDNQEFLVHVVFNHLPLYCRLCDERFKCCDDLKSLGICNRRLLIPAAAPPQPREDPSKSFQSPETSTCFINKTPSGPVSAKRKEYSIDGDYNGNFGSFTSPPELSRNTSTPMHATLIRNKAYFPFKTPRSPNFMLKTPKTTTSHLSKVGRRNDEPKESSLVTISKNDDSPSSESNYLSLSSLSKSSVIDRTPLRSILSNRSINNSDNSNQEFSRTTGRKLGAMQELNEEPGIEEIASVEMDLTDPLGGVVVASQDSPLAYTYSNVSQRRAKERRDSGKRVRFSDQFDIKPDVTSGASLNATEGEEFFEARQSISEMSMAVVEKLSTSSAMIARENEQNAQREKTEIVGSEFKSSPQPEELKEIHNVSTSSSSRVVMMVVVEKNGNMNAADLAPLIDSSLKKLEGVATSATANPRGNSSQLSPRTCHKSTSGSTVVSVDSYMSVSTVECYSTPDTTIDVPQKSREEPEASNSATGSGGLFSAVAHAMRVAFRNFSGSTTSKNTPREIPAPKEIPAIQLPAISDSSGSESNLSTSLVSRSAKRSRDNDEPQPIQTTESAPDTLNDIRSPLPKRPRGWYKIRAREPIARMRNGNNAVAVTSPRGVSSETQCFQQGSLSVGDTILPIPSRAHQSTQTD